MRSKRLLLLVFAGTLLAGAQDDPPGRVARLNHISGSVSFQPAGVDEWVPATVNRPLTTGDRLWSDTESRAELHLGSAALRIASRTAFQFLNLDDRNVQIKLTDGTLSVQLRSLAEGETFEVDTPNLSFALLRPGDYRIDADPDAQTTVATVRQGQGQGIGRGDAFDLRSGEQARVTGEDSVGFDIQPAPEPDGWDRWCIDRTRREDRVESASYVSRDVIGYEDLDTYGSWTTAPDYGPVWTPRAMPIGWAPYRFGHWAWIEPWGWTWVDDAPWGFAPFHYGRWAYYRGSWAWVPGPVAVRGGTVIVRPVYSPALVAWVGGAHWGVSVAIGGGGPVGWVPLGPREVFVPGYHASPTYVTRVNTTNTVINNVNVTNIYNTNNVTRVNYVNQTAPNGITAISANAMATARPVNQVARTITAQQLSSAQVLTAAPVAPRREGVLGRAAVASVSAPPDRAFQREVVARTTPPPPPVPFSQRRSMLDQNPGRPLDTSALQQLRSAAPAAAVRPQVAVVPARPTPSATVPRVTGQAPAATTAPTARPTDSWRKFDDRPQSQRPSQGPAPSYRTEPPVSYPAPAVRQTPVNPTPTYRPETAPAVRQAPVNPSPTPSYRNETVTPAVRQAPASRPESPPVREAAPSVRQPPVVRSESGERATHPSASQPQRAPERKAEGAREKPLPESK